MCESHRNLASGTAVMEMEAPRRKNRPTRAERVEEQPSDATLEMHVRANQARMTNALSDVHEETTEPVKPEIQTRPAAPTKPTPAATPEAKATPVATPKPAPEKVVQVRTAEVAKEVKKVVAPPTPVPQKKPEAPLPVLSEAETEARRVVIAKLKAVLPGLNNDIRAAKRNGRDANLRARETAMAEIADILGTKDLDSKVIKAQVSNYLDTRYVTQLNELFR
jgi:outer membrane biosynthesis protein TonB